MTEASPQSIVAELEALKSHIQTIMSEVAAVRHPKAAEDRLHTATQELDAIVAATEGATNDILETAEKIGDIAGELTGLSPDPAIAERADRLNDLVGALFTGCAFQDITGQRVNKVIGVLKFVEERITAMIDAFGPTFAEVPLPRDNRKDGDKALLNGPQDANKAVSQDDIDSMFG
jgi:chemotaxis protein CheZ